MHDLFSIYLDNRLQFAVCKNIQSRHLNHLSAQSWFPLSHCLIITDNTIISTPLSDLFNLCVSKCVFPQYLKIAEVIPIFKKGDKNKTINYRPISLLSQLDKLLEKMIYSRISAFLEKYNLLSETQFGFRKNFSTIHAVSHVHENLLENVDRDRYSCCLFLELSKAFDTVDHKILLHKLERLFGMRETVYQYTMILNTMNTYESINCGIPQGSCLGPLLFL